MGWRSGRSRRTRVSLRLARRFFGPLVALGAGSVVYWYWTELHSAGDLRLYLLVQFGSLLAMILMIVLYRSPLPGVAYVVMGLGAYGAAKLFEEADARIFSI